MSLRQRTIDRWRRLMSPRFSHRPELSEEEGERLVRAARDGDRAARERLFALYAAPLQDWLQGQVGARLSRAVSLSDMAQETYLRSMEALRVLPDDAGLAGFEGILFQNARWYVLKQARSHRNFEGESAAGLPPERATDPAGELSEGLVTRSDQLDRMRELIDRLPQQQAEVVRRRLAGKTFAAIASELEITDEAARKRHMRGTLMLQGWLRGGA